MEKVWKDTLWQQYGAAIDMLENAISTCPDKVWGNKPDWYAFWYNAYHTIFFLDYYLEGNEDRFTPPEPFTLSELDPQGVLPERVYTKEELLGYLTHGRKKCKEAIYKLTDETAHKQCGYNRPGISVVGLLLYTMRHVQHHAAQLNLMLRQQTDSAPLWVSKVKE